MLWGTRSSSRLVISSILFLILLVAGGGVFSSSAETSARQGSALPASYPDIPLRVMVPAPHIAQQLQQSGKTILDLFPSLDPVASFSPGPRMDLMLPQPGGPGIEAAPANPFKTLAVLVQFTDNTSQVGASYFDTLIFGTASQTMRGFYREVSYNQLDIITLNLPSSSGWKTAPETYAYYTYNSHCIGGAYPHNCQKLAEDVASLVDSVVDFSQYDNNGDGAVDTMIIVHAGRGGEYTGDPGDVWSHSSQTYNPPYLDGKYIRSYTIQPEYLIAPGDMTHGVYAHELGHAFGLPDFYDIDYSSAGVGNWSLMSGGSWNGINGNTPASLDAWSRVYLEFNTATDVTSFNGTISLPNVEQNQTGAIYRVNTGSEYWLLENRQLIGTDSALPGSGLLIWHVDDDQSGSNTDECKQVDNHLCFGSHFRMALEQADGNLDLEYYDYDAGTGNEGDTGDPYPGVSNNRTFSASSNPNTSTYYTGSWTGTEIFDISSSASTMTARIATSTEPEITVEAPGPVNVSDGGTYNMGTTMVGVPLTRTITVRNTGTGTLHLLTNPPTITGNFSGTSFGQTTLGANETTTFNLTCTAASAGSPVTGSVSFTNDDDDENPFNFAVTCTVADCSNPANITTETELGVCIHWANLHAGADTLVLGENILLTAELPRIASEITINGGGRSVDGNDSVRVFYVESTGNLTLNSVTVQNGYTEDWPGGSGILNDNGTLNIINSTISGNVAYDASGGGITNYGGTLNITNSTISNNEAAVDGGGIYAGGTLNITDSTISGNSSYDGAGIYVITGTMTITGSTISDNDALNWGGGIHNYDSTLNMTNSTVSGNSGYYGGGIFNHVASVVTVTRSTISGNSATLDGGGIENYDYSTTTITNSTISGNSADYGGGISNYDHSTLTITGSTIAANSAASGGGGLYHMYYGAIYMAGTILDTGASGNNCYATITDNGYNLADDYSCNFTGTGSRNEVTLNLGTLAYNDGGSTRTHLPGSGSAAIGAIPYNVTVTNNGVTLACNGTMTDQNNITRPRTPLTACTSGAVEVAAATSVTLSINDVTVTEGNSGTTNATFTVTLSATSSQTVTVQYATANGTATAGSDYTTTSGTLTFSPGGALTQPVTVPVLGDTLDEPNETFVVNLSNPTNATIADNQGTGTITDDDPTPTLSINDVTVTEGNSGTTNATFTVTLSATSSQTVTVQYATANGTATAGSDYTTTSGTLTFSPGGALTQPVTVPVLGDTLDEPNETFVVNLSNPTNATIADNQGTGTITDDDPTPTLSINDVTVTEGNSGTTNATFTVTLSAASSQTVTVQYATANGTATAGSDYTTTSGTLTFSPGGALTQPVTVPVIGDTLDEPNETFVVNLSNPTNATIADNQGTGTITDDDGAPALSINDVTVIEGNSGTTNATFTVTLSATSSQTVTVQYATGNGTATTGSDFTATSGTLTFSPGGALTQPVTVPVLGDTLDEPNETFTVNLSNPGNATITDGQGVGTITDDDPTPTLGINDVSVTEGNSGTTNATFTVTLSATSGQMVTVQYATANGTATAGSDYTAASGTLTFSPGSALTRNITVPVTGDTTPEPNETFFVNLSGAVNAALTDNQGTGTIQNDDGGGVTLLTPPNGSTTTNLLPVFSWNPLEGAPKYRLQVDDTADFSSPVINLTQRATSYTPSTGLSPALYYWRVQALGADGLWGSWSAGWTVTIQAETPVKLTLLSPVKQAVLITNLPVFDWTDAAGADHYELQVDDSPAFDSLDIGSAPAGSTYTAVAPLADGKYYWRVRACDAAGTKSAWTLVWTFTIAYTPGGGTGQVLVESGDPLVLRAGVWTQYNTPLASGGSYLYSSGRGGDVMSLLVTGLQVNVIYVKHPALGSFVVEVDGVPVQLVNSTAPDSVFGAQATIALSAGQHLLRVYPRTGTIAIDAFAIVVDSAQPLPPVEFVGTPPPPAVEDTPVPFVTGAPVAPTALPVVTAPPAAEPTTKPPEEPVLPPVLPTIEPTVEPTVVPPTPTPLPVLPPFVDTFDSGTGWTPAGAWRFDTQTAYRGAGWFADSAVRGRTNTLTAQMTLDLRLAQNPELGFWQRVALARGDSTVIEVSQDNGGSWQVVDQQAGTISEWAPYTISLAAYRGGVVRLRFRLETADGVPPDARSTGWWIDELTIWDAPVIPPTSLPTVPPTPTVEPPTATPVPTELPTVTPALTEPPVETLAPAGEGTPTP